MVAGRQSILIIAWRGQTAWALHAFCRNREVAYAPRQFAMPGRVATQIPTIRIHAEALANSLRSRSKGRASSKPSTTTLEAATAFLVAEGFKPDWLASWRYVASHPETAPNIRGGLLAHRSAVRGHTALARNVIGLIAMPTGDTTASDLRTSYVCASVVAGRLGVVDRAADDCTCDEGRCREPEAVVLTIARAAIAISASAVVVGVAVATFKRRLGGHQRASRPRKPNG